MIGMQVAALGVILGSLKGLVKGNEANLFFWFLVVLSGIINFYSPATEPIFIFLFGLFLIVLRKYERSRHSLNELGTLAFVCFKAGSLVFGSGLAIVPMLQHDVVDKYKWLTQSEFLDALAFGQMTPGPVVITATYIGHRMHGMPGAVVATVAMFAMAFIHMNTWFPHVMKKLHDRAWINDFLFGALAAVVGPIIVAVIRLGLGISLTPFLCALAFVSFIATLQGKTPLWLIIPIGGVLSLVASYFL
jgi:chromate transport protein ChrA